MSLVHVITFDQIIYTDFHCFRLFVLVSKGIDPQKKSVNELWVYVHHLNLE